MTISTDAAFEAMKRRVDAGANERCIKIAQRLRQRLFHQQISVVDDPERHKALLCPRRAGKSYALAVYMLIVGLEKPHANIVFIARTRDKAKDILWDTAQTSLKKLNKDFEIGADFSEVHTALRLPNGSRIRLRGCETMADVEQFRGEPFHLVVIDESASFTPGVLDHLLKRAIEPTLGDFLGTVVLAGTPGPFLAGPFYRATGDKAFEVKNGRCISRPHALRDQQPWDHVEFSWSFHHWSRSANVAIKHLDAEAVRIRELNGWTEQNPIFLREYIGRWIPDDANLVYRFHPERNIWVPGEKTKNNPFGLPPGNWRHGMGMDFGTKDPFALTVMSWSDNKPDLYQSYEFTATGFLPGDFAREIQRVRGLAEIEWMVGDFGPFGDLLQQQMQAEYGLNIEKALKRDKRDNIELLNGDFADGRCFLLADSQAARQMLHLSWDHTGLKEHLSREIRNDAADAVVYTRRRALHHFFEAEEPKPIEGTPAYDLAVERAEAEAYIASFTKQTSDEGDGQWRINEGDQEETVL